MSDEQTALLSDRQRTPIPKLQLAVILLLQICEVVTSYSILPYINQVYLSSSMQPDMAHSHLASKLIEDLGITGGDNAKLGYYAGLIVESSNKSTSKTGFMILCQESLFYVAQAATILQWGRISDRIGRKPILLIGLMGSALSMLCFGLSRTFATLVIR